MPSLGVSHAVKLETDLSRDSFPLTSLPVELLERIFEFLETRNQLKLFTLNRDFSKVLQRCLLKVRFWR